MNQSKVETGAEFWTGFLFGASTAWVVGAFFVVRWAMGVM